MSNVPGERFLTAGEVAARLRCSMRQVYRLLAEDRIPYFRPPGTKYGEFRILQSDLDAWIALGRSRARAGEQVTGDSKPFDGAHGKQNEEN